MKNRSFIVVIIFGFFMLGMVVWVTVQKFELACENASLKQQLEQVQQQLKEADATADIALKGLVATKKTTLPAPVAVYELPDGNWDWLSWCDIVAKEGDNKVRTVTHGIELPVRFSVQKGVVAKRAN